MEDVIYTQNQFGWKVLENNLASLCLQGYWKTVVLVIKVKWCPNFKKMMRKMYRIAIVRDVQERVQVKRRMNETFI